MRLFRLLATTALVCAIGVSMMAQAAVTAVDIDRLDASATDIRSRVPGLRTSDPTLASSVEQSLATLTDEITYLRVRLRREGNVPREDYAEVRDRLETLRVKAAGEKVEATPASPDAEGKTLRVPVGATFQVRLPLPLSSATARVEERFEATTILDYSVGSVVAIPAGSTVRGFVSSVRAAGKLDRQGSLTLSFDELRIGQVSRRLRASVSQALDGQVTSDVTRIGTGAAVGAILGGVLGGGRGALLGVLIGAGGTMAATEGSDVNLPAGTLLTLRVDQPIDLPVAP